MIRGVFLRDRNAWKKDGRCCREEGCPFAAFFFKAEE